jgi:hypothetical protein
MPTQNVPAGFIMVKISTSVSPDGLRSASVHLRNKHTNQSFDQGININTVYEIPVAAGAWIVQISYGTITSGVEIDVKNGETSELIDFAVGK